MPNIIIIIHRTRLNKPKISNRVNKTQNLKILLNPSIFAMSAYFRLFPQISNYFRLFPGYVRLFPAISAYVRRFSAYFLLYLQHCGMEGLISALAIGHQIKCLVFMILHQTLSNTFIITVVVAIAAEDHVYKL